jgi:carotenoid cleavage dioxygenase
MAAELPFHLQGNFAPVQDELTVTDLEVVGAIPPELDGLYVRNGANPKSGFSEHWFLGDGMVHGVRLQGGRAAWYRNRYVRTKRLEHPDAERISPEGVIDRTLSCANTSVFAHAGEILALEEGSFPYVLDAGLETKGWKDYDGRLTTAFSAHPHFCPETGEMLCFGYGQLPPYLVYLRVSPDGKLVQSEEISVPGPTMMHDFMITRRHAIFMDLPVVFDLQAALAGTMPFKWSDEYGARIGIMPREGTNADVRWFEVEPCYVFHTMNAWDEGDHVHFDVCRISELWREAGDMTGGMGKQTLHRFSFDLASGGVSEQTLDERGMDFPRVADARVGLKNRYGYTLQFGGGIDEGFAGHLKFDLQTGTSEQAVYEGSPGEPCFVAAPGADPDSDAGWVLSFVYDESHDASELAIVDASEFTKGPVARIKLPRRVPYGFHGSWVPEV